MCYSSRASLIAYLVNLASSIVLFQYHKLLGLFWGYIGIMQLFDYIFWNNHEKNQVNFIFTKIAMFFNLYQPLILALLILYFQGSLKPFSTMALLLYLFIATAFIMYHWNNIDYTLVTSDSRNNLNWKWATSDPGKEILFFFYMLVATLLFWEHFKPPLSYCLVFIIWFTLIMTRIFHKGEDVIGRLWCNISAYIPIFLAFVIYYNGRQK